MLSVNDEGFVKATFTAVMAAGITAQVTAGIGILLTAASAPTVVTAIVGTLGFIGISILAGKFADYFYNNVICNGPLVINGSSINDLIFASNLGEHIYGGDGNDTIYAYGGNDTIYGDNGNDTLNGGDGRDYLDGGKGDDELYGDDDSNFAMRGLAA